MTNDRLVKAKQRWREQPDEWLLKAAREDLSGYSPEIQGIILEEVRRRGLVGERMTLYCNGEGQVESVEYALSNRGQEAMDRLSETLPGGFILQLVLAGGLLCLLSVLCALFSYVFFADTLGDRGSTSLGVMAGGLMTVTAWQALWPRLREKGRHVYQALRKSRSGQPSEHLRAGEVSRPIPKGPVLAPAPVRLGQRRRFEAYIPFIVIAITLFLALVIFYASRDG